MTLTIDIPDELIQDSDPARDVLEALVLERVRSESMDRRTGRQLLGMERLEFGEFLHQHGIPATTYGVEDLKKDLETIDELRSAGLLPG